MKTKIIFLALLVFSIYTSHGHAQKSRPVPKPSTLTAREIAEKVMPSVVMITTQDENGKPISQGSGFVYKPGVVVSNLHVFERATNAVVKNVKTGQVSNVTEVLGIDQKNDICVFRISNSGFPALTRGDSNTVAIGDDIYVAGNPRGLEGSFTKGIISNLRSEEGLLQIDAAISPGSSGGVLVNSKAEAIGIIKSSILGGQNLNFAIPIQKLELLSLRFKHPVLLAGACAFNDRLKSKLKGPVKSVVEDAVDTSQGKRKVLFERAWQYDKFGNNVRFVSWDASSKSGELKTILRKFDDSGLIFLRQTYSEIEGAFVSVPFEESIKFKIELRHFSGSFRGASYVREGFDSDTWIISKDDLEVSFDENGNLVRNRRETLSG